jgi:hypothetical protein
MSYVTDILIVRYVRPNVAQVSSWWCLQVLQTLPFTRCQQTVPKSMISDDVVRTRFETSITTSLEQNLP